MKTQELFLEQAFEINKAHAESLRHFKQHLDLIALEIVELKKQLDSLEEDIKKVITDLVLSNTDVRWV